jgi:hypothetical protein
VLGVKAKPADAGAALRSAALTPPRRSGLSPPRVLLSEPAQRAGHRRQTHRRQLPRRRGPPLREKIRDFIRGGTAPGSRLAANRATTATDRRGAGRALFVPSDRTYDFGALGLERGDGANFGQSLNLGGSRHLFFWRSRRDAGKSRSRLARRRRAADRGTAAAAARVNPRSRASSWSIFAPPRTSNQCSPDASPFSPSMA